MDFTTFARCDVSPGRGIRVSELIRTLSVPRAMDVIAGAFVAWYAVNSKNVSRDLALGWPTC